MSSSPAAKGTSQFLSPRNFEAKGQMVCFNSLWRADFSAEVQAQAKQSDSRSSHFWSVWIHLKSEFETTERPKWQISSLQIFLPLHIKLKICSLALSDKLRVVALFGVGFTCGFGKGFERLLPSAVCFASFLWDDARDRIPLPQSCWELALPFFKCNPMDEIMFYFCKNTICSQSCC